MLEVELDPDLAERLHGRWPNVDVLQDDGATMRLPAEPFRVIANLPFEGATRILRQVLLLRADVIVEWDVAVKRAWPWSSTVNDVRALRRLGSLTRARELDPYQWQTSSADRDGQARRRG